MNEPLARTQSSMQADPIGFFGKLPTHGDFISSALGSRLKSELDRWVQNGLIALEARLGSDWRRLFHATKAWRFVVGKGIWAPSTIAGVLLPSRDRVGRSFPLIIAVQLQHFSGELRDLCEDDGWFQAAEALAETSHKTDFDMQHFIEGIKRLRPPFVDKRMAVSTDDSPASLWWRINPGTRRGSGFRTMAAPMPDDFVKLVTRDALDTPATAEPPLRPVATAAIETRRTAALDRPTWTISHSQASHPGTRFSLNADCVLVNNAAQIFAIADGVGDGIDAIEASRITTGILAAIPRRETLQALVQDIKSKLSHAHAILRAKNANPEKEAPAASVIAAALLDGEFAAIWAGDARSYLLREGMMRMLTQDHLDIGLRRRLGRGLGLKEHFAVDTVREQLQPGDRLLLASGPLSRILTDRMVAEVVIETALEQTAEALIQEALIANCRDNVSVIVVGIS